MNSPNDRFVLTRSDMEAAVFGAHAAMLMFAEKKDRWRALLSGASEPDDDLEAPPALPKGFSVHGNKLGRPPRLPAPAPTKGFKQEYHADGEPMYLTNPDGSVRLTSKGVPYRKMHFTPEVRKRMADRVRKEWKQKKGLASAESNASRRVGVLATLRGISRKEAALIKKSPKGGGSIGSRSDPRIKMKYYDDGSPMYRTNNAGHVIVTATGAPWKRLSSTIARAAADASHKSRGVGTYVSNVPKRKKETTTNDHSQTQSATS